MFWDIFIAVMLAIFLLNIAPYVIGGFIFIIAILIDILTGRSK